MYHNYERKVWGSRNVMSRQLAVATEWIHGIVTHVVSSSSSLQQK